VERVEIGRIKAAFGAKQKLNSVIKSQNLKEGAIVQILTET
jgi:hypothetical protein